MSDLVLTRDLSSDFAYKAINEPKGEFKRFSLANLSVPLPDSKLKLVLGGYGGTCHARISFDGTEHCFCNYSRQEAINIAACLDIENGTDCSGNWCCDNCGTASWVGPCDC